MPECKHPHYALGFCSTHYQRAKRGADLLAPIQVKEKRDPTCTVKDCKEPHKARGLCDKHLQRLYATGTVELSKVDLRCGLPGCTDRRGRSSGRGWCKRHYRNWWRFGDPLGLGSYARDPERRAMEITVTPKVREDLRMAHTMLAHGRTRDAKFYLAQAEKHGRKLTRLEREFANGVRALCSPKRTQDVGQRIEEVLALTKEGRSATEIARKLGITTRTVHRIRAKSGIRSKATESTHGEDRQAVAS